MITIIVKSVPRPCMQACGPAFGPTESLEGRYGSRVRSFLVGAPKGTVKEDETTQRLRRGATERDGGHARGGRQTTEASPLSA